MCVCVCGMYVCMYVCMYDIDSIVRIRINSFSKIIVL